jgi:2',3'-cyclic-nucleotide 2'-phosphodiesterase (5'-nucleotidase family)
MNPLSACTAVAVMVAAVLGAVACAPGDGDADTTPAIDAVGDAIDAVPSALTDACGDAADAPSEAAEVEPPRFPACDATATRQTLTFVHVNDLHGAYNMDQRVEGESPVARLRGYFEAVRAEQPYALFTDGGDDHEKGSVVEQLSEGYATAEVTRAMRFDVRVLGNHDFAWSPAEVLHHAADPHAVVLASNLRYTGSDPRGFGAVDYAELQVGCLRVGFFGMVSGPWDEQNESYEGDFYPEFPTRFDVAALANEIVSAHRADVDVMVMVSHLGLADDALVAAAVDGIDLVLGGHSHDLLPAPAQAGGALIVQAGSEGLQAARIDLTVDLGTRKVVDHAYHLQLNLPGLIPIDPYTQLAVQAVMSAWGEGAFEPVGTLKKGHGSSEVADLTARAVAETLGADGALIDEGTVWDTWSAGEVSPQDLLDAFKVERQRPGTPGFNSIYLVDVAGADLARLVAAPPPGWHAHLRGAPPAADDTHTYGIAVQKHVAFHPADYLGVGVAFDDVVPVAETFTVLRAWAEARQAACVYLDGEDEVPGCAPRP